MKIRSISKQTPILLIGSSVCFLNSCKQEKKESKPNILFIAVDDLRHELGCFGAEHIHSPNIDRIASDGIAFNNSFCNVPVCGASRASLLTGVRPTNTRFVNYYTWADKDLPGHYSLPRLLKDSGYTTISLGKIYHHRTDDSTAWSKTPWRPKTSGINRDYITEQSAQIIDSLSQIKDVRQQGPAWEFAECNDTGYVDGKLTTKALQEMEMLSKQKNPFFLAVGFVKPHLPFNCPKKYWDLYDHNKIEIARNPYRPRNAPDISIHNSGELRNQYSGVPDTVPLPEDYSRWLRHGYFACVSYIDAQIGKLVEKLEELDLDKNTIIIIWGDHGWNLGEHTMWCKHCNYETSLRAPIIINVPGKNYRGKSDALVEYIDIYPSLVELCGLSVPEHCEGKSFVPLLENPDLPWKEEIYCWWKKGLTLRTPRYQYTEWMDIETEERLARMLYDHETDTDENVNISELPKSKGLTDSLSHRLRNWWNEYKEK